LLARSDLDRSPLYDVRNHAIRALVRAAFCELMFSRTVWLRLSNSAQQAGLPSRSSQQPVRLRPLGSGTTALLATRAKAGGARRDRTDDLMLAKHALSQLSYGPVTRRRMRSWHAEPKLAATSPPTPVGFRRGSLALAPASEGWWAWEDLNFRPHAYQARALTN
jgi:hypothetical protein